MCWNSLIIWLNRLFTGSCKWAIPKIILLLISRWRNFYIWVLLHVCTLWWRYIWLYLFLKGWWLIVLYWYISHSLWNCHFESWDPRIEWWRRTDCWWYSRIRLWNNRYGRYVSLLNIVSHKRCRKLLLSSYLRFLKIRCTCLFLWYLKIRLRKLHNFCLLTNCI